MEWRLDAALEIGQCLADFARLDDNGQAPAVTFSGERLDDIGRAFAECQRTVLETSLKFLENNRRIFFDIHAPDEWNNTLTE